MRISDWSSDVCSSDLLHICHSCAKHKQVFPSEIKYYTQSNLERHLRHGDPDEGGQGHPFCQFCKTRFYDKQTLYEHLNKDHYSCHLCERKGVRHVYELKNLNRIIESLLCFCLGCRAYRRSCTN